MCRLEWMTEESLLKFVSDVMVVEKNYLFFECLKCKFTNLPLSLKYLKYFVKFNLINFLYKKYKSLINFRTQFFYKKNYK